LSALLEVDGVDPNAKNELGQPLLFVCITDPGKLRTVLAHSRLEINALDRLGNTALAHTVIMRASTVIGLLVEAGIDRGARNVMGKTAWDLLFAAGEDVEPEPADPFDYIQRMSSLLQRARPRSGWGHTGPHQYTYS
jgi:ankyrin repeat protein